MIGTIDISNNVVGSLRNEGGTARNKICIGCDVIVVPSYVRDNERACA